MGAGLGDVGVVGWVRVPSSVPRKDTCLPRINHGVSMHHMKNLESQPSDNNSNSEMGGVNHRPHRPSLLWSQRLDDMDEPERDQFLFDKARRDLQGVFDGLDIERSPFRLQGDLIRRYGATYGGTAVSAAFYEYWYNHPLIVKRRNDRKNRINRRNRAESGS